MPFTADLTPLQAVTAWIEKTCKKKPGQVVGTAGAVLLLVSYTLVFELTRPIGPVASLSRAALNTAPAVLLALGVNQLIHTKILGRSVLIQAAAHLFLSAVFAVTWYFLVTVLIGASEGWVDRSFTVAPFSYVAFVWQIFQGVTLYALAALFTYALDFQTKAREAKAELRSLRDELDRQRAKSAASPDDVLILPREDEHVTVPHTDIVRISGAGDHTVIVTKTAEFSSRTSLATFEASLSDTGFFRAHRSHLLRLSAVLSAEPAGNGRMTFHLANGETIEASRAGARAFRARAV